MHTREQEDAGLDHRGGVQECRDRRRRRHGVGQPEMERELRRLGEGTQQHQQQRRQIARIGLDQIAAVEHRLHVEGPDDMADQQETGQHRQPAHAGDGQGHAGASSCLALLVPVADQQKRRQAGQFPEYPQQQQVVGHDDADHGSHEQHQVGVEPRHAVVRRQIIAGIQNDQQPDAQDQQQKQQREPVEPERQIEPQLRHPAHAEVIHLAGDHSRRMRNGHA